MSKMASEGLPEAGTDRTKPALRQTSHTSGFNDSALADRGAAGFVWHIDGALELSRTGLLYYDSFNILTQAISALTAKLTGAVSARTAFPFNSESNPPAGRENTDTASRVMVVYSF